MSLKYNQATLDRMMKVLAEGGYVLRFEKGTFNSGFCILEHKKVVVINKFLDMEGRIATLVDLMALLKIDENILSVESRKTYRLALEEASTRVKPPEAGDSGKLS